VEVRASAQRVAARVLFDDETGLFKESRVYEGPVAGPLRLLRRVSTRDAWLPAGIEVDGSRLLFSEVSSGRCAPGRRSSLRALGPTP